MIFNIFEARAARRFRATTDLFSQFWAFMSRTPIMCHLLPSRGAANPRTVRGYTEEQKLEFEFKRTLLDRLDEYFVVMRRMKKADREGYKFFSVTGVPFASYHRSISLVELSPWFRRALPSHGGVFFHMSDKERAKSHDSDLMPVTAVFFRRYEKQHAPSRVQPVTAGELYIITAYFDESDTTRPPVSQDIPVLLMPDGSVRALKTLSHRMITVQGRHGKNKGKTFSIPQRRWEFYEFVEGWAKEHGRQVEDHIKKLFVIAANAYEGSNAEMAKIIVSKGNVRCCFNINVLRTPYFFRERDAGVTKNGTKRRIFHIVRAHKRVVNGKETYIKTHFRGDRDFLWQGYRVKIIVPGWHGADISDLDIPVLDADALGDYDTKEFIEATDVARKITKMEDSGLYGKAGRRA